MQLGLSYSLRKFIEDNTGIQTVIHYDGIKLPKEESFIQVKSRSNMYRNLAKARETVVTTYRYEVMAYGSSLAEVTEMQDKCDSLFLFEEMPLYTDDGKLTNHSVMIDVVNQVPLYAEEVSSETNMNRVYFNLEIDINKHKNRGK